MLGGFFGEHFFKPDWGFSMAYTFQGRWVSVEGDEHLGRASTNKTTETIFELSDTVRIKYGVFQGILTENWNMRRITAKFFPRLLTNDQKQRRVNVCLELRERRLPRTQLLFPGSRRVTKVGITVMIQKQNSNRRSENAHNLQEQKGHCRSGVQKGACSFFSTCVPPDTTVSSEFYCEVLRGSRENL
jgi:hypothetical protein